MMTSARMCRAVLACAVWGSAERSQVVLFGRSSYRQLGATVITMWIHTEHLPARFEDALKIAEPDAPPLDDYPDVWVNLDTGAVIARVSFGSWSGKTIHGIARLYYRAPGSDDLYDIAYSVGRKAEDELTFYTGAPDANSQMLRDISRAVEQQLGRTQAT